MNLEITQLDGKTTVRLEGRIDSTNANQFLSDLQPLMSGQALDIEVDCSGMEYTSSQGLRAFIMLQKSVKTNGGSLLLRDLRPNVKEVFDITGFSNIIKII